MALVRLQLAVVGELHVDHAAAHLGRIDCVAGHHRGGGDLVGHLDEGLVLALEHQHVGHTPERNTQGNHVRLAGLVWNVAQVDDFGGLGCKWRRKWGREGVSERCLTD